MDGTVQEGRGIEKIGAHCKGHNSNSIGICYIGGLNSNGKPKDTRTLEQQESLNKLVKELIDKYNLSLDDVYCHNQFANKACPCFSINSFINEFKY